MKIFNILFLILVMTSCTSTTNKNERLSREPVKYWNFKESEKDFVNEIDEDTSGNIYYWNYQDEEQ